MTEAELVQWALRGPYPHPHYPHIMVDGAVSRELRRRILARHIQRMIEGAVNDIREVR